MASLIIYVDDPTYLDFTLADIRAKTKPEQIDEIIVCDDRLSVKECDATIRRSDKIGRVRAWQQAADVAKSEHLIFLRQATKVQSDWLTPLLSQLEKKTVVSPVIHTLDASLWGMGASRWKRFGWRWDLQLYDRFSERVDSPAVSAYCLGITKTWLSELGGFDLKMPLIGHADAIELSLRSWLFGGRVEVADKSVVAVVPDTTSDYVGLVRIAELWFGSYSTYFYDRTQLSRDVSVGRLPDYGRQVDFDAFLVAQMPELLGVYRLRQAASGKSVAVVGSGASVDLVDVNVIARHDVVIGLDYMGLAFDCDYVMTDSVEVISQLRAKYRPDQFILPLMLENRLAGTFVAAQDVVDGCVLFERGANVATSVFPPFFGSEEIVHAAAHLALFLGPRNVVIYGCDGQLLAGRSHSAKIEYYDDGFLWSDSESTRRRLVARENGLHEIGMLATKQHVPMLRVGHV